MKMAQPSVPRIDQKETISLIHSSRIKYFNLTSLEIYIFLLLLPFIECFHVLGIYCSLGYTSNNPVGYYPVL